MNAFLAGVKHAVRIYLENPAFTITAVTALAISTQEADYAEMELVPITSRRRPHRRHDGIDHSTQKPRHRVHLPPLPVAQLAGEPFVPASSSRSFNTPPSLRNSS
jgi:hypothetical protein